MTKMPHLLLPALLASLLAGCTGPQGESTAPPMPAVRSRVVAAARAEIPTRVELQGSVEAERTAAIAARVMATVTAVHVRAGERIERGQLLLSIDPAAAQGQLSQAHGALAQAQAALALAQRNAARFEALAEGDAASDLEVEMARMQFEQAQGAVEQAGGAVQSAASIAGDSRVTAPFAGRVTRRLVEVGDLAAPGRPLMMVESESGRRLALTIPESVVTASRLVVGDELAVSIDARPDLGDLAGTVVEMSPGADPMSHSFAAKVELAAEGLFSGAAGRASIVTGSRHSVSVPQDAILRHGGLELVVLDENGHTTSRAVTTGRARTEGTIEVLSGLEGGERLLVGLAALPPAGSPIEEIDG
jgi:RND family efflux transporter MFP subunit